MASTLAQMATAYATIKDYSPNQKYQDRVKALLRWVYLNEISKLNPATQATAYQTMLKRFTDLDNKIT